MNPGTNSDRNSPGNADSRNMALQQNAQILWLLKFIVILMIAVIVIVTLKVMMISPTPTAILLPLEIWLVNFYQHMDQGFGCNYFGNRDRELLLVNKTTIPRIITRRS